MTKLLAPICRSNAEKALFQMLETVTKDLVFTISEAQHPKSSAIHKLGRPITPSFEE
jgi:hypothetical protein